ncbi:MAG: hypothetical protein IID36_05740 [Planctomycetes bacterium]|nr:hypothetical protein [Planctomycetota bacterium]
MKQSPGKELPARGAPSNTGHQSNAGHQSSPRHASSFGVTLGHATDNGFVSVSLGNNRGHGGQHPGYLSYGGHGGGHGFVSISLGNDHGYGGHHPSYLSYGGHHGYSSRYGHHGYYNYGFSYYPYSHYYGRHYDHYYLGLSYGAPSYLYDYAGDYYYDAYVPPVYVYENDYPETVYYEEHYGDTPPGASDLGTIIEETAPPPDREAIGEDYAAPESSGGSVLPPANRLADDPDSGIIVVPGDAIIAEPTITTGPMLDQYPDSGSAAAPTGAVDDAPVPSVEGAAHVEGASSPPGEDPSSPTGPAQPEDSERIPDAVLGHRAFQSGQFEEARSIYIRGMLEDDTDGHAKLFFGLANYALGKYDVASIAVRRALTVTPDLINRPLDVRSMYPDADVYESHLAALKKHVEANPDDRGARFLLGFIHYGSARPEAALALFKQLADADPEDELAAAMRDSAARVIPPDGSASQP